MRKRVALCFDTPTAQCPSGSLACYFATTFACAEASLGRQGEPYYRLHDEQASAREAESGEMKASPPVREFNIGVSRVYHMDRGPSPFAARGVFWWISWASHFVFRPGPRLELLLAQARNALPMQHPVIGLHARQGDACRSGTGNCVGHSVHSAFLNTWFWDIAECLTI